jgi:hypothetical protein
MDETTEATSQTTEVPLGQRLFDRPFLLLLLGLLVMFVFYTGWGLFEVLTLPEATLP